MPADRVQSVQSFSREEHALDVFLRSFTEDCTVKMPSGKTVKLILYEVLQFACLSVPVFVVMERFASLVWFVRSSDTAYWLVVAASVAYVASVTLFVWVPLKYSILKTQRFSEITNWWVYIGFLGATSNLNQWSCFMCYPFHALSMQFLMQILLFVYFFISPKGGLLHLRMWCWAPYLALPSSYPAQR